MILFRPNILSFKAILKRTKLSFATASRNLIVLGSMLLLSLLLFFAMKFVLTNAFSDSVFFVIPADILLVLCLNIFLPMIFFTNLSGVMNNFFMSEDLEFLLSSPLRKFSFYIQRTLISAIESSWMTIVALLPFLLAIAACYETSPYLYVLLPFVITLFVLIPAVIASAVGILWALFIPRVPPRFLMFAIIALGFYLIFFLLRIIKFYLIGESGFDSNAIVEMFYRLKTFGGSWSPATWMARSLAPFFSEPLNRVAELDPNVPYDNFRLLFGLKTTLYSILAGLSALLLVTSIGFLLFLNFYSTALSSMWGRKRKLSHGTSNIFDWIYWKLVRNFPKKKQLLGLIKKEFIELTRDSSQIIQIFMLVSFFSFYLYALQFEQNFKVLSGSVDSLKWKKIVFGINISLECFMVVAMALRLTFPSLSREGRGIWVMRVSPAHPSVIISAKYIVLLIPIVVAMSILSFISNYLNTNDFNSSLLKAIFTVAVSSAIGSLSMLFGAIFANFSWESKSQLIASVGSIVFMVFGLAYVGLNLLLSLPLNHVVEIAMIDSQATLYTYWGILVIFNVAMAFCFFKLAVRRLSRSLALGEY